MGQSSYHSSRDQWTQESEESSKGSEANIRLQLNPLSLMYSETHSIYNKVEMTFYYFLVIEYICLWDCCILKRGLCEMFSEDIVLRKG